MNDELRIVTLAALLHDVGKFYERAWIKGNEVVKPDDFLEPGNKQEYGHVEHSWITEYALNKSSSEEREFITLAAHHHKRSKCSGNEAIVSQSDSLSAGHERIDNDEEVEIDKTLYKGKHKHKIPLLPILERISKKMDDKNIIQKNVLSSFFKFSQSHFPEENKDGKVEEISGEYKNIEDTFSKEFNSLLSISEPEKYAESVRTLLQKYFWCMPESTKESDYPDSSLYDHLRISALVAGALYKYQNSDNNNSTTFLLYCGVVSGVQRFIYDISTSDAYKTLKGRSFFVHLLPLLIAKRILRKIEMDDIQIIYASGGYFYLLLPNIPSLKKDVDDEIDKINLQFFSLFGDKLYVQYGSEDFSQSIFKGENKKENIFDVWEKVTREAKNQKNKKFSSTALENYDLIFNPKETSSNICSVCQSELKNDVCGLCKWFIETGQKLKESNYLIIKESKELSFPDLNNLFELSNELPSNTSNSTIYFLREFPDFSQQEQIDLVKEGNNLCFFPTGGLHKLPGSLDETGKESEGSPLIGFLRIDVDDLGFLFSRGLRHYNHSKNHWIEKDLNGNEKKELKKDFNAHTFGRLATMSTQLSFFFGTILQQIIDKDERWKDKANIVYAGGDDVFIIGSWDIIPKIAIEINNKFKDFTCDNPAFTLSAGIVVTHRKYPLYRAAVMSGEALEKAKQENRKNAVNFMGETLGWDEFEKLQKKVDAILEFKGTQKLKPLVNRIVMIGEIHEKAKDIARFKDKVNEKDIVKAVSAEQWRWKTVYSLHRLAEDYKNDEFKKVIFDMKDYFLSNEAGRRTNIENAKLLGKWLRDITREE